MIGLQDPQRPDGGPLSMAGNTGCGLCKSGAGSVSPAPGQPKPEHSCRRESGESAPLDAAHARIGELIREYGAACAAFHFGSHVTAAYQACMAEIERQYKC